METLTLTPPPGAAPDVLEQRRGRPQPLGAGQSGKDCGIQSTVWDRFRRPGPPRISLQVRIHPSL